MTTAVPTRTDERVVLTGVSWQDYELFLSLLDDHPGVRLYYLKGELEIMTTSPEHERAKSMIRRLLEYYAIIRQIDLRAYGSTTFRKKAKERGAEPDECYVLGRELGEFPELAIEVVVTHGGIDKLAIYEGLGVPEVWFWKEGAISVHCLSEDGYQQMERSRLVPDLDISILARYSIRTDQLDAINEFHREIQAEQSPEQD